MKIVFFSIISLYMLCTYAQATQSFYVQSPYMENPLGEGEQAPYTPQPLWRTDGFDCTTYVETILAEHAQNRHSHTFQQNILQLRYATKNIDFFNRTHLMEYHWIPNAIKKGFILPYELSNTKDSRFTLNLQEWFAKNPTVKNKDAAYFTKVQQQPSIVQASVPYLLRKDITQKLVTNLPDFMVVFFLKEIKEHSWPGQDEKEIFITHMGILNKHILYHASSTRKKVQKIDLMEYMRSHPKIVGVSFYIAP